MLSTAVLLLHLALAPSPALGAEMPSTIKVGAVTCRTNVEETESLCDLQLLGTVGGNQVLTFRSLPTDVVSYQGMELGRSGYNGEKRYHAGFLPRAYSLSRLEGFHDPKLQLLIRTVSAGDKGIYAPETIEFQIIHQSGILQLYLRSLGIPIFQLSLIALLLATALVPLTRQHGDGWGWKPGILATFYVTAALYCAAMTSLPKVVVIYFVSPMTYDFLHAFNQLWALWALVELVRGCRFTDPFGWPKVRPIQPIDRFLGRANLATLVSGAGWLVVTWLRREIIWVPHSVLVFTFATLATVGLARSGLQMRWKSTVRRSNPFGLAFAAALAVCVAVQMRDASLYVSHTYGTFYYNRYAYLLVLLLGAARSFSLSRIERSALAAAASLREGLRSLTRGDDRLSMIAERFQALSRADRVSIISIRDGAALILASAGPAARAVDRDPKRLGRWVRKCLKRGCSTRIPVYVKSKDRKLQIVDLYTVPIRQGGKWVSAITVMKESGTFAPGVLASSDALAAEVAGEVTSALAHTVVEQQVRELEALAVSTSGILFEQRDSWGRLREISAESRRVIVSADGIRTTHLAEVSQYSPRIREVSISYKRVLYAEWMAIRTSLELISKDVRGDDFWALSPREFKDPQLRKLGAERVCLLAASLIEERCREISSLPEFRILGRPGAHVAVAAGDILFLSLGTERAKCIDVDAPIMSRLHRIRSEARPGEVLVDVGDQGLREALSDTSIFVTRKSGDPATPRAYSNLHRLPDIAHLTGLRDHPVAREIRERVEREHSQVPADSSAGDRRTG